MSNDRIRKAVLSNPDIRDQILGRQNGTNGARNVNILWRILSHPNIPLFEIIVIMMIFSLFWLLYTGAAFRMHGSTTEGANIHRMIRLSMAVQTYKWINNEFPHSLGDLVCEGQDKRSSIPIATTKMLRDMWGTPYQYENMTNYYTIRSLGADKKNGGDDLNTDINLEGP